jgi:hypothetical protein
MGMCERFYPYSLISGGTGRCSDQLKRADTLIDREYENGCRKKAKLFSPPEEGEVNGMAPRQGRICKPVDKNYLYCYPFMYSAQIVKYFYKVRIR